MADAGKRAVGRAAADLVERGMRLGLGTGSTVAFFLEALYERGLDVAGVASSEATAQRCRQLGLRLLPAEEAHDLDLTVDGADELDRNLTLTKGGGGALLREKVLARASARMVVIATVDKVVDRLGRTFPLPVEVVPFAAPVVVRELELWGFEVTPRGGGRYRTDNRNAILDLRRDDGIDDPGELEVALALIPGVVESGLFVDLAHLALLGDADGAVHQLARPDPAGA